MYSPSGERPDKLTDSSGRVALAWSSPVIPFLISSPAVCHDILHFLRENSPPRVRAGRAR